jgi:SIR2-like domain
MRALEPKHVANVINYMLNGRVIPFLGAGVNLCGRPTEVKWSPSSGFLPSGWELTEYLAQRFSYPHDPDDLLRVSEYATITEGTGPLYDALHELFDTDYNPTCLHHFLAYLPSAMRDKSLPVKYPLIVTTNYDDVLEVAFRQANEPYDLVYYEAKAGKNIGKFWHRPPGGKPQLIERPNKYRGLSLDRCTIILKIHGAVTREEDASHHDSYVITEDDYIDYMLNADFTTLLPIPLPEKLMYSSYLFLGYSLKDWNLRVILRRIWKSQDLTRNSWAVKRDSDTIDDLFWTNRNVDVFNVDLQDYIANLSCCLKNWPHAGGGA